MNPLNVIKLVLLLFTATLASTTLANGLVRIVNEDSVKVEVDVRQGTNERCNDNRSYGPGKQTRLSGETIEIPCNGPQVCWRYRKAHHRGLPWSGWNSEACLHDRIYKYELN